MSKPEKNMKHTQAGKSGKEAGKKTGPADNAALNINREEDWKKIQSQVGDQVEKLHAHADRFFTSDEELPLSQHLLLVIIAAFFVVFIVWANFASLDEVTRGDGRVVPSSDIQVLQSLEGGIVDQILAREGEEVEAGQVLMRLRDIQATADLGANRQRYLGLMAKSQRLRAEAEGLPSPQFSPEVMEGVPQGVQEELEAFRANLSSQLNQTQVLEQQLSQREQEVSSLRRRLSDTRETLRMARQERDMIAPLVERGSAPRVELLQLDRGIQERQTELNSLQGSLGQAESSVNEAKARLEELRSAARAQAQTELSVTTIEMNTIRESLSALEDRRTRTEIRAPLNGFVQSIKINTIGGVVQPGADIIEIVPKDDQLIVEARIRPADIAFLHPGQPAVVKITAYDYSIYGGLPGELIDISADTITNEQGETFYRVRVRTHDAELRRHNEVLPIIPGMVTSIDIMTGKKTVMEYLLKPLVKTLDSAMRER